MTEFWNHPALSKPPAVEAQPEPARTSTGEDAHVQRTDTTLAPQPDTVLVDSDTEQQEHAVALRADLQLMIDHHLHGDAVETGNLCVIVGRLTREVYRAGRQRGERRTAMTPLGSVQSLLRLDVQEILGEAGDAALEPYSMRLNVSARLLESGLFQDGQRIALAGPIRLERTYDARFATDDLDPGLPVWGLHLDVLSVQSVFDDTTPDGSLVRLEGEIDGEPLIRLRPIGPGVLAPFASVRLRYRKPLRGAFARSKAQYSSSVLIPLEVPLDGGLPDAGALLKSGNTVRIEGRIAPYLVRRSPSVSERATLRQRETAARFADALSRVEEQMRAQGGTDLTRRISAAKRRMLNTMQLVVSVGYVELSRGTPLADEQIAELIQTRPRRMLNRRPRPTTRMPPPC
jgi:hypothetical protein